MRTYLVVVDEDEAARVALRFAARRAARTEGSIEILAIVAPPEFVQWGGVQAAMDEEARLRVDALVLQAAGELIDEVGLSPAITVRQGEPVAVLRETLAERPDTAALVIGASASGEGGPLLDYLTGPAAAAMPCPIMIIPGSLSDEAIDRLS